MMGTEDKTLLCFCHWGRTNKVLPYGSISYGEGVTDQVIVKTGIKYNEFVNAVFDRLGIDPSDKMLHFTVKFDRSQLIRMRDQKGVDSLFQFNDDFAHVYALSLGEEHNSRPPSGCAEKAVLVDSNKCGVLSKAGVGKLSPHQENNIQSDFSAQFSYLNQHQLPTSPAIQGTFWTSAMPGTFWTKCPSCNFRFRYYRNYMDLRLRCNHCLTPFIAHELRSQVSAGSTGFPPAQTGSKEGAATAKCRKRIREQIAGSSESTPISLDTEDLENENGNNPPAGQGI